MNNELDDDGHDNEQGPESRGAARRSGRRGDDEHGDAEQRRHLDPERDHGRFKPGHCYNRYGRGGDPMRRTRYRAKAPRDIDQLLADALCRKVRVMENGKRAKKKASEVFADKLVRDLLSLKPEVAVRMYFRRGSELRATLKCISEDNLNDYEYQRMEDIERAFQIVNEKYLSEDEDSDGEEPRASGAVTIGRDRRDGDEHRSLRRANERKEAERESQDGDRCRDDDDDDRSRERDRDGGSMELSSSAGNRGRSRRQAHRTERPL